MGSTFNSEAFYTEHDSTIRAVVRRRLAKTPYVSRGGIDEVVNDVYVRLLDNNAKLARQATDVRLASPRTYVGIIASCITLNFRAKTGKRMSREFPAGDTQDLERLIFGIPEDEMEES